MRLSTTLKTASKDPPDNELIQRLQAGEELALNLLMGRYKERLYNFILRYVSDQDAAYDILQETFIRLYFKADKYDASYRFSTWLYQIAVNLCRDHARKLSKSNKVPFDDNWISDVVSAEDQAISRQELVFFNAEIQKLPGKLKDALILYAIDEHSQAECAKILGTTAKTVETRVYRARKILMEKMRVFFEG